MSVALHSLPPGRGFRSLCGTLVRVGLGSATVRLTRGVAEVEFATADGERRHFRAQQSRIVHWSLETRVLPENDDGPCTPEDGCERSGRDHEDLVAEPEE